MIKMYAAFKIDATKSVIPAFCHFVVAIVVLVRMEELNPVRPGHPGGLNLNLNLNPCLKHLTIT